jgi:SPP1 family predicted phage head-tail adaptor
MATRAGRLDERLTPQVATRTWSNGEATETWADGSPVWATVAEMSGREQIRAGQVAATQPVVVTCRYLDTSDLRPQDRFVRADGTVLEIVSAREVGRREEREFVCALNSDGGA